MNLFVSLILSLAILGSLALYWRMRWRILLPASAVFFLALLAYNSVRGFAYLAVDKEYLAELASTRPELMGYEFDPESMSRLSSLPLYFNEPNGSYDKLIKTESDHPWSDYTQFVIDNTWVIKNQNIVAVRSMVSGYESDYFSGFGWGPDALPGVLWLVSQDSLKES